MRRWKPFFYLLISILFLFLAGACTMYASGMKPELPRVEEESLGPATPDAVGAKLARYASIRGLVVEGDIRVRGRERDMAGGFTMTIDGDDMDMLVRTGGVTAASMALKGGTVSMMPGLDDEYQEYMLAVIMRDAVTWWNIREYAIYENGDAYTVRNSWKTLYIQKHLLVPSGQTIRLLKSREVYVSYGGMKDFGFGPLPSSIMFSHAGYECRLDISRMTVEEIRQPWQDPDQ